MSAKPACRIGAEADATYRVANLSSLLTVCAAALDSAELFNDEIRERVTMDIKHVLEMGAIYADETIADVERAVEAAKKGGAA